MLEHAEDCCGELRPALDHSQFLLMGTFFSPPNVRPKSGMLSRYLRFTRRHHNMRRSRDNSHHFLAVCDEAWLQGDRASRDDRRQPNPSWLTRGLGMAGAIYADAY